MRRSFLLFGSDNRPTPAFAAFMRDVQVPGDHLASIDAALQARFFQKGPDGQPLERWELKKVQVSWPERFRRHLQLCGFVDRTIPQEWWYSYAAWPGALLPRVFARFNDLIEAWRSGVRWNETIIFGGKRSLRSNDENVYTCCDALSMDEVERKELEQRWQETNPQTELDMMRFLWEGALLPPDLHTRPVTFVDAPMKPPLKTGGPRVRPSTEDTILEWLHGEPSPGPVLLSSGAPYGMAQDEAFWMLLEPHGFTVQTFGHAAPELPVENFMREVAGCVNRIRKARLS